MLPESDSEDIENWAIKAKAGSEEAFSNLVRIFESRLQALLYRILFDWEETRDVAQETFFQAYRALNHYQSQGKFQSWLFQIGVRKAYDSLRKKKSRPLQQVQNEEDQLEIGIQDQQVKQNEIGKIIEEAVQQLPPQQRIPFILAEYEGYGYQQIADTLGVSVKGVERHLYRARESLREKLRPYLLAEK